MTPLERLEQTFTPAFFGDCDATATAQRLSGYLEEAQAKTQNRPTNADLKAQAQEAWVLYRVYSDGLVYLLSNPEQINVDSEGSVKFGDLATRIRAMERARDAAEDRFNALMAEPNEAKPKHGQPSGHLPVKVVF